MISKRAFTFRSYHNPIGSVYHDPGGEEGWGWPREEDSREPAWSRSQYNEDDRSWSGRNLLPYETLSGDVWQQILTIIFKVLR